MIATEPRWPRAPELLIAVGSWLFIVVLAVSAYFEADIRWLHFFQSGMYVATIVLASRRNRWAYFIGLSAAGFWDYVNLFVTSFFFNGLHWLFVFLSTGRLQHADQMIAVPGWIGNLLVIVGCIWGYLRIKSKEPRDGMRFAVALILTMGYFAAAMAMFQPRYLPLFRRALQPRWPVVTRPAR